MPLRSRVALIATLLVVAAIAVNTVLQTFAARRAVLDQARAGGDSIAEVLARAVGRRHGIPVLRRALSRVRATPRQHGDVEARRRNVRDAFAVRADVAGRRLLLVDDVFTTGATADACAAALLRAGAAEVGVLTLARVE